MQIISIKTDVCDCTHSRKVQAEDRPDPPPYVQPTSALEVCMEPGGIVGRLSRLQTFSKIPFLSTELPEVGVTPLGRGC